MIDSQSASMRWLAFATPNFALASFLLCGLLSFGGCRLCADCDEDAYPSYGGAWQRTNRDSGRVGSLFDPGGSRASDLSRRAQSDGPNTSKRFDDGAATDEGSSGDNQNQERDRMDTDGVEPSVPENADALPNDDQQDEELRKLEERYRNLKLEEIYHRAPQPNSGDWQ